MADKLFAAQNQAFTNYFSSSLLTPPAVGPTALARTEANRRRRLHLRWGTRRLLTHSCANYAHEGHLAGRSEGAKRREGVWYS